ncbi:MAG TPA: acyltransferase [Pirellulales bacterium]|nr:acyltransferase [Pirellulales bacterium]
MGVDAIIAGALRSKRSSNDAAAPPSLELHQPGRRQSLLAIDLARGLAALSVFVYHYGVAGALVELTGISAFRWVAIPGARWAVPFFFAISGFCIHLSEISFLERTGRQSLDLRLYARRRFWRIYPTYAFALLFSCTIVALRGESLGVRDFLIHAANLQALDQAAFNSINVVLWSVSVEMLLYLIYPVWLWLRLRVGLIGAFSIGCGISLATSAIVATCVETPVPSPAQWFFVNLWAGWLAGAALAEGMTKRPELFRTATWWIVGVAAWLLGLGWQSFDSESAWSLCFNGSLLTVLTLWPLSGMVLAEPWFHAVRQPVVKYAIAWVGACGLCSYSLYLLHEPLIHVRMSLVAGVENMTLRLAAIVVGFPAIVGCCWLSYVVVELPFMKYRGK